MFSLLLSLRSRVKCKPLFAASKREAPRPEVRQAPHAFHELGPRALHRPLLASHRGSALKEATFGFSSSPWLAGAAHRSTCASRSSVFCMSVVGASRRSAAPGNHLVGAAGYGSSGSALRREVGVLGSKRARPYRLWPSVPAHRLMLNPSIERTCPGKPGHASHIER